MNAGGSEDERLRRRLERERRARREAERIAERTTSALYDRQRELELLQAVSTAANDASSLEEVLRATIRGICAHLRWPVGHAWIAKGSGGRLVSSGIWHLDDPARHAKFRRISEAKVFEPGEGLPGMTIARAEPVWIEDVMRHQNFPRRHQLEPGIVHGALGFPVLTGGDAFAMVEVSATGR